MPGPPYHGRTHTAGGSDPIPGIGGLPAGFIQDGLTSRTVTGGSVLSLTYGFMYTNDTAYFSYQNVTGGKAQYLKLLQPGFYKASFSVSFTTSFSAGDIPYIEPTSDAGTLVNAVSVAWDDTQTMIYGEQQGTAELAYGELVSHLWFNFATADVGQATLGIGCNIGSINTRTKSFASSIAAVRLGDALSAVTIV